MNHRAIVLLAMSLAGSCALQAQTNPLITESKATYTSVKNNLLKAA